MSNKLRYRGTTVDTSGVLDHLQKQTVSTGLTKRRPGVVPFSAIVKLVARMLRWRITRAGCGRRAQRNDSRDRQLYAGVN